MTLTELLTTIDQAGLTLTLNAAGDGFTAAPRDNVTDELRALLKINKPQLIDYLTLTQGLDTYALDELVAPAVLFESMRQLYDAALWKWEQCREARLTEHSLARVKALSAATGGQQSLLAVS